MLTPTHQVISLLQLLFLLMINILSGMRCYSCLPSEFPNLPDRNFTSPPSPLPSTFPSFPTTDNFQLVCYANSAYANDPRKQCSTTGYSITLAGGAVVYKSKTQSCTALSSTKEEFYSVVSAAKAIIIFTLDQMKVICYICNRQKTILILIISVTNLVNDFIKYLHISIFHWLIFWIWFRVLLHCPYNTEWHFDKLFRTICLNFQWSSQSSFQSYCTS